LAVKVVAKAAVAELNEAVESECLLSQSVGDHVCSLAHLHSCIYLQPGVMRTFAVGRTPASYYMLMAEAGNGDYDAYLGSTCVDEPAAVFYALQVAAALEVSVRFASTNYFLILKNKNKIKRLIFKSYLMFHVFVRSIYYICTRTIVGVYPGGIRVWKL
jgi:hypothetical protein